MEAHRASVRTIELLLGRLLICYSTIYMLLNKRFKILLRFILAHEILNEKYEQTHIPCSPFKITVK